MEINSRVIQNLPRTTNDVEGWHNTFDRSLCVTQPSIWKIIDALQKDSAANHLSIAQQAAGQAAPPQKRRYRVIDQQISNIVGDYGNGNTIDFLGISSTFAFSLCTYFSGVFSKTFNAAFNNILMQCPRWYLSGW